MKKYILSFFSVLFLSHNLWAMPCDAGWACTSSSGRYQIEVGRCFYDNQVNGLTKIFVKKVDKSATAKLGPAWDGDKFLAIQVNLNDMGHTEHMLSLELNKNKGQGIIREKTRVASPDVWKEVKSEKVFCTAGG